MCICILYKYIYIHVQICTYIFIDIFIFKNQFVRYVVLFVLCFLCLLVSSACIALHLRLLNFFHLSQAPAAATPFTPSTPPWRIQMSNEAHVSYAMYIYSKQTKVFSKHAHMQQFKALPLPVSNNFRLLKERNRSDIPNKGNRSNSLNKARQFKQFNGSTQTVRSHRLNILTKE